MHKQQTEGVALISKDDKHPTSINGKQGNIERDKMPVIMEFLDNLNNYISAQLPTPKIVPMNYAINLFKLLNGPVMLLLMYYYRNFTPTAILFSSLYGLYGIIWISKDLIFPDRRFQRLVSVPSAMGIGIVLIIYWWNGYFCIANYVELSAIKCTFCVCLHSVGLVMMVTTDVQKYVALKYKPGHLIQDGMFTYIRHPNYVGEMMIYATYGFFANNWIGWAILSYFLIALYFPYMYRIEESISRYPEWKAYKARTGMILPNFIALLFNTSSNKKYN